MLILTTTFLSRHVVQWKHTDEPDAAHSMACVTELKNMEYLEVYVRIIAG